MRWRPKHSLGTPWWVWLLIPIWGPLYATLVLVAFAVWTKRRILGPTPDWRPWFAWHPVKIDDDDGWPLYHRVWLEWVERRASHVSADAVYQHPRPLPHQREEANRE